MIISNNLSVFVAVADTGSFTKASRILNISQPAVSKAVGAVEDELGVRLFVRDKRSGLVLTEAGKRILVLAQQMKQLEERMRQTAYNENHLTEGTVRIASLPVITATVLADVLPRYKCAYPAVKVEVFEGTNNNVKKMVGEYKADFGFSISPFGEFERAVLFRDSMVAISAGENAGAGPLSITASDEPLIFCKAGYEVASLYLFQKGLSVHDPRIFLNSETVIALVQKGNGTGVVSEYVLDANGCTLPRRPVRPAIHTDYAVIANSLADLCPAARAFLDMVHEWVEMRK